MSHHSEDSRSAAQRRADYERFLELRKQALARMAAIFEIWRDCDRRPCRRGKRCAGPSPAACWHTWWRANTDDDTRTILHAAVKARAAGAGVEEAYQAADRMEARIAADRAALAAGKSWHEVALAAPVQAGPAQAAPEPVAPPVEESEAVRAARIRTLREAGRGAKGLAHWAR